MTKRSQRLKVVLDLAERKKKQADQLLAASRARVEKDRLAVEQLKAYLADYQNQYETAGRQGFGIARLEVYQSFIRKITAAIQQQEHAAQMNRNELEIVERHWTQCYGQAVAMDKLVDKARTQEQQAEDKKLQQQLDERSQLIKTNFI